MKKLSLTKLDNATKILLVILVVVVSYFIILLILRPFFAPSSMMDMMNQMTFGRQIDIILSIIIVLIIGIIISFYLFRENENKGKGVNEFNIIRKAVSDDEKKILDEIKKAGEITQDSLRFRLNWSKAKISTILTNLDKRELIQRERIGKTYKVYLQKH